MAFHVGTFASGAPGDLESAFVLALAFGGGGPGGAAFERGALPLPLPFPFPTCVLRPSGLEASKFSELDADFAVLLLLPPACN